ncbi:MAG: hypothetical protein H7Z14_06130 [Anaerolineae bacterium]|nr:hypothetical protein [Phycisphaerae bacterium]
MLSLIQLILMVAATTTQPTSGPATQPAFPQSWTGRWTGPATIASTAGRETSFEMELGIAPTDDPKRFTWEIVYISGGNRQVRPYELLVVDAANGKYVIDEKSSILIDAALIDGALYSQFLVGTVSITASYRISGDVLTVELITTDPMRPLTSGGENQVPIVTTNLVKRVQRAELRRK